MFCREMDSNNTSAPGFSLANVFTSTHSQGIRLPDTFIKRAMGLAEARFLITMQNGLDIATEVCAASSGAAVSISGGDENGSNTNDNCKRSKCECNCRC